MNASKLSLCDKTRELLRTRPREVTFEDISEATGYPRQFLSSFINGHIKHPSVHKVQRLYEYITGKPLEY